MAKRKKSKSKKRGVKIVSFDLAKYKTIGPLKAALKRAMRGGKVRLNVKNAPFVYR
jgi:hypothetical protein